jgi:hypothetical protein
MGKFIGKYGVGLSYKTTTPCSKTMHLNNLLASKNPYDTNMSFEGQSDNL